MSESSDSNPELQKTAKRRKPGIIYLSIIPSSMNVLKLRQYFEKYGQIGKVFLQPTENKTRNKGKHKKYSEGWVEFKSKRKAKFVQNILNNTAVGGKRRNPDYDMLWNIKYLPRFKWDNLTQRLEYERQIYNKRMKAEIYQVNKETDHYLKASFIAGKMKKRKQKKGENKSNSQTSTKKFKAAKYKTLFEKKKKKKEEYRKNKVQNDDFVNTIFVGSNKVS